MLRASSWQSHGSRSSPLQTDGPRHESGRRRASPDARCNDATLGTAAVLLGALWLSGTTWPARPSLPNTPSTSCWHEQEPRADGTYWPFVPLRFLLTGDDVQMPNWSHGQAGIAAALAAAGMTLERADLVGRATSGAEYLLSMAETSDGGLRLASPNPRGSRPGHFHVLRCHGPTETSLLYAPLDRAEVPAVASATPRELELACLHSLRVSGIPRAPIPRRLGQRRPLLRHGRGRRCRPQRVAAPRPR